MDKNTQLDKIKQRAKALLDVGIITTDYSPMIVSHPFTKSGIVLIPDEEDFAQLNIVDNKTAFVKWKSLMQKQIDNARNVFEIYFMLNDSYSLLFFNNINEFLTEEEYGKLLSHAWTNNEYANSDANVDKKTLLNFFKKANKQYLLNEEEQQEFKDFDDQFTIYRGVTNHNKSNIRALSWTLSPTTANFFATRFGSKGKIYRATIDKNHVYAYFTSKGESEVIVDPKYLQNISLYSGKKPNIEQPIK